jgi:hypothetical protein
MARQLLHGAQVAAALQQVAGVAVAQHVRVHLGRHASVLGLPRQAQAQLVGTGIGSSKALGNDQDGPSTA